MACGTLRQVLCRIHQGLRLPSIRFRAGAPHRAGFHPFLSECILQWTYRFQSFLSDLLLLGQRSIQVELVHCPCLPSTAKDMRHGVLYAYLHSRI